MPQYPIPAVFLARLAVAGSVAGRGLGAWLLRDAMLRTLAASEAIGVRAQLVHAIDEEARALYLRQRSHAPTRGSDRPRPGERSARGRRYRARGCLAGVPIGTV
jgi:hypothetical protein